jgi:two-component system OmpR family sensor kinase
MSSRGESAAAPRRTARWLARRTLRGRLIAGLLALLALACGVVGIVSYLALHSFLLGQLDSQLATASDRYAGCLNGPPPGNDSDGGQQGDGQPQATPDNCGEQQGAQTFSATVRGATVYGPAIAGGDCRLSAADSAVLTSMRASPAPYTRSLSYLGTYRLLAVPGKDGSVYISGLPLSPVTSTLQQVEVTEAAVFLAVLLFTGVIGTGWVRLSLRPLRRVAATATRVTQLPLGSGDVTLPERVPDADPRTEVGQVGAAFNRMLGHVERALTRRAASEARLRRFAADASHELRTPLAAIRGYAELARRHPGPVPDDVAHALARVESEAGRMSVLVDELLLLAQLDAGRPLASEPVDLTRLAIDAASDARVAAADHRWILELPDEPVSVRGDEHRLRQVLVNLLSNAARHTPRGTTVTVSLLPAAGPEGRGAEGERAGQDQQTGHAGRSRSGQHGTAGHAGKSGRAAGQTGQPRGVRLSVTDDGPGIPADLQPALFERFVRGDSARSRSAGSTGLGLAIVDAVVAAHGGGVTVTSRPGRTSFVLTLPPLDPPAGSGAQSPPGSSA